MTSRSGEEALERIAMEIHGRLVSGDGTTVGTGRFGGDVEGAIRDAVEAEAGILSERARSFLRARVVREVSGLGPLEELLDDRHIQEVMVNGFDQVYVERDGRVEPADVAFTDDPHLRNTIERILAPLGRRVDELSPMVDARLPDGSRVNVVIPPLSVDGPAISIRRFPDRGLDPDRLLTNGSLTEGQLDQLRLAISDRRSLLVSGGTGSGKTTLLNALSSFITDGERVVTIEDAAELKLRQPHVVRLETRPAGIEGRGEVTIRDLLRNALRMRPDRIVIGEVRGAEAFDLLSALNTGHDGVMSTVHASSADDALARIEVLALMAGVGLPAEVIERQLRRGLDLVVHVARMPGGGRKVVEIRELTG
jgi:pilus assembly protein CpaF